MGTVCCAEDANNNVAQHLDVSQNKRNKMNTESIEKNTDYDNKQDTENTKETDDKQKEDVDNDKNINTDKETQALLNKDDTKQDMTEELKDDASISDALKALETYVNSGCEQIPKFIFFPSPYKQYETNIMKQYENCIQTIQNKLNTALENKTPIHPYYVWTLSKYLEYDHDEEQKQWENKLYDYGSEILLKAENMTKNEKHLAKMCLAWVPRTQFNYDTLMKWKKVASATLQILAKPLETEYKKISDNDNAEGNKLVALILNDKYKYISDSVPQGQAITQEWILPKQSWKARDTPLKSGLMMKPDEILECQMQLKEIKLNDFKIFKQSVYDDFDYDNISNCEIDFDDLYREYIRMVGCKLNNSFQKLMNELFILNRQKLNLSLDENKIDKDLGHSEAAVKSISRVLNKEDDYRGNSSPLSQYILDWVRCGIIIETVEELLSLYELICEKFGGNIIRIKNGFGKDVNTSYGYRAVLINLIYENDGLKMICEVQLILLSYLKVRKKMHLYYKIARVECDENSFNADIGAELAGDFSKAADLQIID
eukprot:101547_1